MFTYSHLKTPQNTTSGVAEYVLWAPVRDFAPGGIQCPVAPFDGQTAGESIQILTPHEFLDGKAFIRVALAPEKNSLTGKTIGDIGFQKQDFELAVFIPGSYAEAHEMVFNMLNTSGIALIKDSNCPANMWYQLGCDCTGCYFSADFGTGTTKDGTKGYNGKFTWQNPYVQLYSYAGGPEELP